MEEMYKRYYMLDAEIGYPRFTGLRRKLSEMVDFADKILQVMCPIYNLQSIPDIEFKYYVQKADCKELASGFHTMYLFKDNSIDYHLIGINLTDTKQHPDRVMFSTVPHEIAHLLHCEIDRADQCKNQHGEMFDQICRMIEFQFPQVEISHTMVVQNWAEHISKISEDAHRFKLS
jgi:hypothetical protein